LRVATLDPLSSAVFALRNPNVEEATLIARKRMELGRGFRVYTGVEISLVVQSAELIRSDIPRKL